MMVGSICVYCGASDGKVPIYRETAVAMGRAIGQSGRRLVYGGGNTGLMGAVAEGCREAQGPVTGIIPEFLVKREVLNTSADDIVITQDMHERKMTMFERSDAFVALPGGIGTLEELVEQLTWSQLGRHGKPIVIVDINGFWRPLLSLFAHMRMDGFIRDGLDAHVLVAERVQDVLPMIDMAVQRRREVAPPLPPM
jgi:uncharacterized protein (TIGR00730 family)